MLNRNDRSALRRNRSAVSWLCLLSIILAVWLVTSIRENTSQREDYTILLTEMSDIQRLNDRRGKMIDSLVKVINYKPIDTPVFIKPYKPIKKDTSIVNQKTDSTKSIKEFILKDTLK
jgi:hypothetical protein